MFLSTLSFYALNFSLLLFYIFEILFELRIALKTIQDDLIRFFLFLKKEYIDNDFSFLLNTERLKNNSV